MARVPRYVQNSLASRVVGTPGVDTSFNSIAQSNAQATNQLYQSEAQNNAAFGAGIAGVLGSVTNAIGYEFRRAQYNAEQKRERLKNALNATEADRHITNIKIGLEDLQRSMVNDRELDPEQNPIGLTEAYDEKAKQFVSDYMSKNGLNPKSKNLDLALIANHVSDHATTLMGSQHNAVGDKELDMRKTYEGVGFEKVLENLSNRPANNLNELYGTLNDMDQSATRGYFSVGKAAVGKIASAKQDAIENYFATKVKSSPTQAQADLDGTDKVPGLRQLMPGKTVEKIQHSIDIRTAAIQREADQAEKEAAHKSLMDMSAITLAANVDPKDPSYATKTADARDALEQKVRQELAKPTPDQVPPEHRREWQAAGKVRNLTVLNHLNSSLEKIDKQTAQIEGMKRTAASQDRIAKALADKNEKTQNLQSFNSAESIKMRGDVEAAFKRLQDTTAKNKAPKFDDLVHAKDALDKAQQAGALDVKGQKQTTYADKFGFLQHITNRYLQKQAAPGWDEIFMKHKTEPAPKDIQNTYNPTNDPDKADTINRAYKKTYDEYLSRLTAKLNGRQPTVEQLQSIKDLVTEDMISIGKVSVDDDN